MGSCKVLLFLAFLISSSPYYLLSSSTVMCFEFEVGGDKGWVVPTSNNLSFYNQWASRNRFQVDDILRFEYKDDSVLVVSEEEYDRCESSHPLFFSNNGDTIFKLDRPGLFYFISGVAGHCQRGLKLIVKVLEPHEESPPPPSDGGSSPHNGSSSSAQAALTISSLSSSTFVALLILSFFGQVFI